jgi:hypothetical protein
MIHTNVGISRNDESFAAGAEAAFTAIKDLKNKPQVLMILNTPGYDCEAVLSGITSISKDIPTFGCTTDGVFTKYGFYNKNLVAVMAMHSDDFELIFNFEEGLPQESAKIGREFAQKFLPYIFQIRRQDLHSSLLILIHNRLNMDAVTKSINNVLGPLCSVIGSPAHSIFNGPYINGTIRPCSVMGVLMRALAPIGIDIAHGWVPYGPAMVATRTEGRTIYEINGQPALEVYKQIWSKDFPLTEGKSFAEIREIYTNFAISRPIGLAQSKGEYLIRDPYLINEDGSVMCGGEVPENAVIHLMQGKSDDLLSGPRVASEKALQRITGFSAEAAIVFDCFTRLQLFGFNSTNELLQIQKVTGQNTNIFGMMSRGEIATAGAGLTFLHNKTVAIGILPKY